MLSLLSFFFVFSSAVRASFDDYTSFVYVGCSQSKYTLGSPYQLNVDSLLTSLAHAATFSSYGNFTCDASSSPAYGLFQCREDLPVSDCASCVRSGLDRLSSLCPSADGAGVQLKGCFLRYSRETFLGMPDTTLFYKKCGSAALPGNYDSQLLAMRDAALAGLSGGSGGEGYRVAAGGQVRALAQCVGDQGPKQCGDCVTAAVAQLKESCGAAGAGDAYLGKCYVSYWSAGGYSWRHYHGSSVNGKTLGIILAVTVVIVILILVLTFVNRRFTK